MLQQVFPAAKFPFPQDQSYAYGIKPSSVNHNDVQAAYDVFLKGYYEESGDQARIKWDNPAQTVSEGIGYGMLIFVFMDNVKNNTQGKFDKLWKYYQSHLDGQGLMNWKINGFGGRRRQMVPPMATSTRLLRSVLPITNGMMKI